MAAVELNKDAVKVFYEEAKEASQSVDAALDRFRDNTTKVLALATGAAAFFGFEDSEKSGLFFAALAAYAVAVLMALLIYWPKRWLVNVSGDLGDALVVPRANPVSATKVYLDLGRNYQTAHKENIHQIRRKFGISDRFQLLVVFTALVVIFGGWNAAVNPKQSSNEPTRIEIVEGEQ
jgi:hypothetical protein